LNYRHAFHAGSFADVVKHAVIARILHYLCAKPAPFRVIDTHAGAGLYDLSGPEASRSGEWRDGIGKLLAAQLAAPVADLLAPYLEVIGALNERGALTTYPGSPAIARAFLRSDDRLLACELEPQAFASLTRNLHGDPRIKALRLDGWTALNAYVPPRERRGLVVIDPPFEEEAEFSRLGNGLATAYRKWATGSYLLWYPIKTRNAPDRLASRLRRLGIAKILRAEVTVAPMSDPRRLNGTGLVLVNPPWTLPDELGVLLPALAAILGRDGAGRHRLDWLIGERPAG
jgi:23S rRNA (adenine2030-N6)-methyltransferase